VEVAAVQGDRVLLAQVEVAAVAAQVVFG